MFITKNWEKGFLSVGFKEHPIKDYKKEKVTLFDVSTKEYPDYPSNFMKNGSFDQKVYCICLLRTILELSTDELSEFLNYQTKLVKDPLEWLYKFDELLGIAGKFQPTEANKIRFDWFKNLVGEECIELSTAASEKEGSPFPIASRARKVNEKFDIIKLKEEVEKLETYKEKVFLLKRRKMDYLQEVKNANKKDSFVAKVDLELNFQKEEYDALAEDQPAYKTIGKKILCAVSAKELAKIIYDLQYMVDESGALIFDGATVAFARMICNCFCGLDGQPFSENSIRKYLTDLKNKKQ